MDLYYRELQKEICYRERLIQQMERELKDFPEGHLAVRKRSGKQFLYWFFPRTGPSQSNCKRKSLEKLPGKEKEEWILKWRLRNELPRMKKNLEALKTLQQNWSLETFDEKTAFWSANSDWWEQKRLYYGKELLVRRWLQEKVTVFRNEMWERDVFVAGEEPVWRTEGLKHRTIDGSLRRSKSEVILDHLLREMGVAYVYERPLYIGTKRFLPDYTILRPGDLKLLFLEHHGLYSEEYERRNLEKQWAYQQAGIVPWSNLLYTYDLPDGTVDVRGIRKALELFLAPEGRL